MHYYQGTDISEIILHYLYFNRDTSLVELSNHIINKDISLKEHDVNLALNKLQHNGLLVEIKNILNLTNTGTHIVENYNTLEDYFSLNKRKDI